MKNPLRTSVCSLIFGLLVAFPFLDDLKLGDSLGGVALWIGPGTEGYFTGLEIKGSN